MSAAAHSIPSEAVKPQTREFRRARAERAIHHMRAHLGEPMDLDQLAWVAGAAKHHFARVFKIATGITPHDFLACLRIQAAKEMLLNSKASVTEICMAVGYSSLGSFSSIFRQHVGLSPTEFRELPREFDPGELLEAAATMAARLKTGACSRITGEIVGSSQGPGIIFIGAFIKGAPSGLPETGVVMLAPGEFSLPRPSANGFHLLAVMLPLDSGLFVNSVTLPTLLVASRRCNLAAGETRFRLSLRRPEATDPPILLALPAFFNNDDFTART